MSANKVGDTMGKERWESDNQNNQGLNERKRKVLWAIVQDYSDTAEPVGSRTIARKYDLGVSSATIRNEMQDLEDAGYLEQPHASAGRVPSIKGYRYYVDWLMKPDPVTIDEENLLDSMLHTHMNRVDDIFRDMAKVVAHLTHSLSVTALSEQKSKFNYARFLPLDDKRAILLVVTDKGQVSNIVVPIPEGSSFDEIQMIADKLSRFLHGKEIDVLGESLILKFQKAVEQNISSFIPIFTAINQALKSEKQVYSGGASQLIEQPEFRNVEKVQDILNLLEERDILESMLLSVMDTPIAVHIGTENRAKSLSDLSVVRAQFMVNGRQLGSVAVLGPMRMQYAKVVGMMNFMQKRLNEILRDDDS